MAGSTIRHQLEQQLSHYMVPGYFFDTDELPYSLNGKLDKKTLILMSAERIRASKHSDTVLAQDVKEVVGTCHPAIIILGRYINIDNMTVDDNLFHFGLSSLQAISFHLELLELYL